MESNKTFEEGMEVPALGLKARILWRELANFDVTLTDG